MKRSSVIYALLFLFISVSCSLNLQNVPKDYHLSDGRGVIALSLTSSGECGYALYVDIRNIDTHKDYAIGLQSFGEKQDWVRSEKECELESQSFSGKLAVLSLPPGKYEMFKFSGMHRYNAFENTDRFSLKFNVIANNVVYLGNAHFYVDEEHYNFTISDKRERDLNILKYKYPSMTEDYIIDLLEQVTFQSA